MAVEHRMCPSPVAVAQGGRTESDLVAEKQ